MNTFSSMILKEHICRRRLASLWDSVKVGMSSGSYVVHLRLAMDLLVSFKYTWSVSILQFGGIGALAVK